MAKFNIKAFGDNLVDYAVKKTNYAIAEYEARIIEAISGALREWAQTSKHFDLWTNRTHNLRSSVVGALLYDGLIIGEEIGGPLVKNPRKGGKKTEPKKMRMFSKNPVFGYKFTRMGQSEGWPNDRSTPKRPARVFANIALEQAKTQVSSGYCVVFLFSMPYANSPAPKWRPMYERTNRALGTMIINKFYAALKALKVPYKGSVKVLKGIEGINPN